MTPSKKEKFYTGRLLVAIAATIALTLLACGHMVLAVHELYSIFLFHSQTNYTWLLLHSLLLLLLIWIVLRCSRVWILYGWFTRWVPVAAFGEGRWDAAVKDSRRAARMGEWVQAVEALQRRLIEKPEDEAAQYNLPNALVLAGDHQGAIEVLGKWGDSKDRRLRWLLARRQVESVLGRMPSRGWPRRAYLGPSNLKKIFHYSFWLLPAVLVFFIAAGPLLFRMTGLIEYYQRVGRGFDDSGFELKETDYFKIYYHDSNFADWAAEAANDALEANFRFYDLLETQEGRGPFAEKKIRLYLCANQKEMQDRTLGLSDWVAGYSVPEEMRVVIYPPEGVLENSELNFKRVIAHEFSHLVFYTMSKGADKGAWLNEGLADYIAYTWVLSENNFLVRNYLYKNHFSRVIKKPMPFDVFLNSRPAGLNSTEEIRQFYTQGFSMVFVLIEEYGKEEFLDFLYEYSESGNMEKAFAGSYPTIKKMTNLRAIWELFMNE